MILEAVSLRDFRNHAGTEVTCSAERNVIVGKNGEGKTNLLEGIAYLFLGRSFYATNDSVVQRIGTEGFRVAGVLRSEGGIVYRVEALFEAGQGTRRLRVGGSDLARRSELIGLFPVVILSPEHAAITSDGPAERRKFVDLTLSQSSAAYLEDTLEYRKALKQRNRLLTEARQNNRIDEESLEAWTVVLVEKGTRIMQKRRDFLAAFQPYVSHGVSSVSAKAEEPELQYASSVPLRDESTDVRNDFWDALRRLRREELRMGSTLAGPHRDEIEFRINGLPVRQYASQGQQKTFLVGLKLAERMFLRDTCKETPIFLLDDVFGELDRDRNERVLGLLEGTGQVFITTADERFLPRTLTSASKIFRVAGGAVSEGTIEKLEVQTAS